METHLALWLYQDETTDEDAGQGYANTYSNAGRDFGPDGNSLNKLEREVHVSESIKK